MASVLFSPVFNAWQGFTTAGLPLSGGLISTYVAGSSTPAVTYTTSAGNIANTNPIQLGPDGRPPAELWLVSGQAYKFILTDSLGNSISSYDNILGIQQNPSILWVTSGITPTYINASQFTAPGNVVSTFPVGIRVRYTINTTQYYGTVSAAAFSGGLTTVTVLVDSQAFTSGLNAVDVSQFTPANSALPGFLPVTFAPTWFGGTIHGATVYTVQYGYGVLVNGFFYFSMRLDITSCTGTGSATISGFPYAANGNAPRLSLLNDTGTAFNLIPSGSSFFVRNAATGSALSAGSPSSNTYQVSGFYPV